VMNYLHSSEIDNICSHILCLSEHHMVEQELPQHAMDGYLLGSSFCWKGLQKGGGKCVFLLR
jgi:hypothetical protein